MTQKTDWRWLQWASWGEGATLLALVLVAVPLKRLADMPEAVQLMGPVHGAAFVAYVAVVLSYALRQRIGPRDVALLMLAALVPFGALGLRGWFARRG